ncbi:MAG: radical SAM protein [Lachnospiraceae bacterium]|nr:radical SAM protein [Lachnospiraceae bacterium]
MDRVAETVDGSLDGAMETADDVVNRGVGTADYAADRTVRELLDCIDVLVDGEFVEERKNLRLAFRGSDNQRLIDVRKSLQTGRTVCLSR